MPGMFNNNMGERLFLYHGKNLFSDKGVLELKAGSGQIIKYFVRKTAVGCVVAGT